MDAPAEAAGVILAGGAARRMGGGDKAMKRLGGAPILARVLNRLASQLAGGRRAVFLSANGDPSRFAAFDLAVVPDAAFEAEGARLGPLAGVLAALERARALGAARVVSVAADTPFFPEDLALRLVAAADAAAAPIALAAAPDADGVLRRHPTFGLWSTALAPDLRRALHEDGVRKIVAWTDAHGAAEARFERVALGGAETVDPFFNVNTPEDLAEAERLFGLGAT